MVFQEQIVDRTLKKFNFVGNDQFIKVKFTLFQGVHFKDYDSC